MFPALDALWTPPSAGMPRVLQLGTDDGAVDGVWRRGVSEKQASEALRRGDVDILIAPSLSPTLLRALRERPCGLVVLTGDVAAAIAADLDELTDVRWLGPRAVLRVGPGRSLVCAHGRDELEGLIRSLGSDSLALALAPAPRWLAEFLEQDRLRELSLVGTIHARALSVGWARWARERGHGSVLVPVGVPEVELQRPRVPELTAVVAAHALERWTGPVFPSPRVITMVYRGLRGELGPATQVTDSSLALWQQARRALPATGAVVGMTEPDARLPLQAPTATFLAQRALLRVAAHRELVAASRAPMLAPSAPSDEGFGRAREVLETAGAQLSDHESKVVLRNLGFEVTRQAVAGSASGAAGFAERIGFPVVLKALSPDLRRHTEIGATALELTNAAAVRRAYGTIVGNVERRAPTARLDGVVVAEHVEGGFDLQAGLIALQTGELAVFARAVQGSMAFEPALALAPLDEADARLLAHQVLSRLPVPALRRDSDPDWGALTELLVRLSRLGQAFGERVTLVDLNPVRLVGPPRGYVILDATMAQRPHLEGQ